MAFSSRVMTAADWKTLEFFTPHEFANAGVMGYEFMRWLDQVRKAADVPMIITSSWRSKEHNEAVGGATDSAHIDIPCNAVDIGERPRPDDPSWNYTRYRIVQSAMVHGCQRIGSYADGSLHLDMTHGRRPYPRMWRVVR